VSSHEVTGNKNRNSRLHKSHHPEKKIKKEYRTNEKSIRDDQDHIDEPQPSQNLYLPSTIDLDKDYIPPVYDHQLTKSGQTFRQQ